MEQQEQLILSDEDSNLVYAIANRVRAEVISECVRMLDSVASVPQMATEIALVHEKNGKLNLEALRDAHTPDLLKEVYGYRQNLDYETGKLKNDFKPSFTKG